MAVWDPDVTFFSGPMKLGTLVFGNVLGPGAREGHSMGIFDIGSAEYSSSYAEEAVMVDASELVANALEQNGMSKGALADTLGIDEGEVSEYLAGEQDVTVRQLAKVLHVLGERLVLKTLNSE